jgi:monoamine oxidase
MAADPSEPAEDPEFVLADVRGCVEDPCTTGPWAFTHPGNAKPKQTKGIAKRRRNEGSGDDGFNNTPTSMAGGSDKTRGQLACSSTFWAVAHECEQNATMEQADVVVLGGGLAGMTAAAALHEAGLSVVVLEAAPRLGGRIFTRPEPDLPGGFLDVGGRQIGAGYHRIWALIHKHGLTTADEDRTMLPMSYAVGEHMVRANDWADSEHNLTVGDERSLLPAQFGSSFLAKHDPFASLDDWLDPKFAHLDRSVADVLRSEGASAQAMQWTEASISGSNIEGSSMLTLLQEHHRMMHELRFTDGAGAQSRMLETLQKPVLSSSDAVNANTGSPRPVIQNIVGGTQQLVEAMAQPFADQVHLGCVVRSIALDPSGLGGIVEFTAKDGQPDGSIHANHIVCALPFSALRDVRITPEPPGAQAEAIQQLRYSTITRLWVRVTAPFWESDGFDPSLMSDGAMRSFLAVAKRDDPSDVWGMFVLGGAAARNVDALPLAKRADFLIGEMARIRPATKGALEPLAVSSWGIEPYVRGLRHQFGPGEVTRWARSMSRPFLALHFAGEHTREREYGLEAAVESGERVTREVLALG